MMIAASVLAAAWCVGGAADPMPVLPATDTARRCMALVSPERAHATVERLVGFGTRHTLSDTVSTTRGVGAATRWLRDELAAAGPRMRVSIEEFDVPASARVPQGGRVRNVVGILPAGGGSAGGGGGAGGGRAFVMMAHADSRNGDPMNVTDDAPGANDDASGCAAVLEVARSLGAADVPTLRTTVIFVLTTGEEQGLLGARYLAEASALMKPYAVAGVLNNDIVGDPTAPAATGFAPTPGVVRLFSEGLPRNPSAEQLARMRSLSSESDGPGRELARFIASVAEREGTDVRPRLVFRLDRFLRGGDHIPFAENGVAAVRFTEVDEDYAKQHADVREVVGADGVKSRIGDLPEFVSGAYVAGVARLNLAALVHLANAPTPPGAARVVTAQLENATVLRWSASPESDVAGYEVVWRETTDATWTHARDVGIATEANLMVSKDDHFFGVRAYDRDGYRSVTAFAGAERE